MVFSIAEAIYSRLLERRRRRFASGAPRRIEGCRVVSVGNLTTGGTGKTPMVQHIARHLQRSGKKVAVVARGYRGSLSARGGVVADGCAIRLSAAEAGDEPLLHARALPGVPVVIGRDRVIAARRAATEFGAEAIVLDDGFQFWSLARDLDLVLLDARRPFGNERLLPAGRLRERPDALSRARAIVLTRSDRASEAERADARAEIARYSAAPVWEARHAPVSLIDQQGSSHGLTLLRGASAGAFSALADNPGFAASLQSLGARVVSRAGRPDHHFWREAEVERIVREAKGQGAAFLVTTEKDAVKLPLRDFGLPIYSLRIEMSFLAGEDAFLQLLSDTIF